jgi:hypothetical protein
MPQKIAYSYIRFSTPEQRKGDSLRRQLQDSKDWAEQNGYVLDTKLKLRDEGESAFHGMHLERGYLGQFLKKVEEGKIPRGSALIVESFDRLSRDKVSKAQAIFLQIIHAGITVVTTMDSKVYTLESLDENPMDLMLSILIMMRAHEESKAKSIRGIKKWINKRELAANGGPKLTGRTKGWLKLSKDRKHHEVIEGRDEIVRRIFLERLKGKSPPRIAREFNQDETVTWKPMSLQNKKECGWWPGYVEKILKDRAVLGIGQPCRWIGNKREPEGPSIPNYYPPIVDEVIFDRVQATFQANLQPRLDGNGTVGKGGRNGNMNNLFAFIARCGYCGDGMQFKERTARVSRVKKGYLVCSRAKRRAGCKEHYVPYDEVENAVLRYCRGLEPADLLPGREEAESLLRSLQGQLTATETQITTLTRREKIQLDEIEDTEDREERRSLRPRLQAVREEKQTLENDLVRIKREIEIASSADHTLQEHLEGLRQLMAAMASLQGQQRIELRLRLRNEIRRLLERIEVYPEGAARIAGVTGPDNLEIHLYFHSGKFKYVYPRVGALTFPEGYEGEY